MHLKYRNIYMLLDHTEEMFNSTRFKSNQMVLFIKPTALPMGLHRYESKHSQSKLHSNLELDFKISNFFQKDSTNPIRLYSHCKKNKVHGYFNEYTFHQ